MRLCELRDVYYGQDIYIIGSGPSASVFPKDFLQDKICMSLNDAYKMHPSITPIAFMHHDLYSREGGLDTAPFHPNFKNIKYAITKASGKVRLPDEAIDWDNPIYYYFDWSHDIEDIWTMTKDSKYLYYTPEGCSLHAAMQAAWIMGAKNIFVIGCDSRTMGGKHYANYDKNGFRDNEVLKRGERNYDSYVWGTLIVQDFLRKKGVNVFNLASIVGFHQVDLQFDVLSGKTDMKYIYEQVKTNVQQAGEV